MARTETGTHTPESLLTIASALQAIAGRLSKTAESMREKGVASLEVKNQAGLKAGLSSLRGFGMAAEEAFEEWVFDQKVFGAVTPPVQEPPKTKSEGQGRKPRKQAEPRGETEAD